MGDEVLTGDEVLAGDEALRGELLVLTGDEGTLGGGL